MESIYDKLIDLAKQHNVVWDFDVGIEEFSAVFDAKTAQQAQNFVDACKRTRQMIGQRDRVSVVGYGDSFTIVIQPLTGFYF